MVKYGSSEVHYGIAIPEGEARYVLDRNKGNVTKVTGPTIFLPDPRTQVIVRRILDYKTCNLLYPNNVPAFQHNANLLGVDLATYMQDHPQSVASLGIDAAAATGFKGLTRNRGDILGSGQADMVGRAGVEMYTMVTSNLSASVGNSAEARGLADVPGRGMVGDQFQRKNTFTAPRMVTLDSKFDGVVQTDIWTGYAMLLVRKSGERKIVRGPQTVLLEYDEFPQVLTLSVGKPKTTDSLVRTVFLKTDSNIVSDIVAVETSDFCPLSVKLSYRVNFEGDPEKWFNVENYVKFLCDHMRSKIRNAVQKIGVEAFYGHHVDILRDVILGKSAGEGEKRPGTVFAENGMHIYDVEVLGVTMGNTEIEKMLVSAQRDVIQSTLTLASERRKLDNLREAENIRRESDSVQQQTRLLRMQLESEETTQKLGRDLTILSADDKTTAAKFTRELETERAKGEISKVQVETRVASKEADLEVERRAQALRLEMIRAEVQAVVDKAKAVDPALVAALNSFGEAAMVEKVAEAMSPLAMIKGSGVMDVLGELLKGTKLGERLLLSPGQKNGTSSASSSHA